MLNLLVRLMKIRFLLPLVLLLLAAQDSQTAITSPAAGEVLRGEVTITGTMDSANFFSAQLDFAYASDSAETLRSNSGQAWFTLQTFSQPVIDSPLFVWDTNSITDGDYQLRLSVTFIDGSFDEVIVPIKIQNDVAFSQPTLAPASTPNSLSVQILTPFLLAASPTPTEIPRPTLTSLPDNPASLNQNEILVSLGRGGLVIIALFVFSGILIRLRRN